MYDKYRLKHIHVFGYKTVYYSYYFNETKKVTE